uniref:T-lymphoma invasion and metastasis-inducing protein 1 n=1 Tax=Anopheles atroparvus TaxID=41427 RepID=A0A182IRI1_ANOAO
MSSSSGATLPTPDRSHHPQLVQYRNPERTRAIVQPAAGETKAHPAPGVPRRRGTPPKATKPHHVTTTASAKKSAIGDDGGGGGGGSGGGASGTGRTPVCRCNAQYKLQDLKALTAKQKQSLASSNVQSSSTSALNAVGTGVAGQGILKTSAHRQHQPLQQQHSSQSLALGSGASTGQPSSQAAPRQSQELTNEELIRFLQQINADIKWNEQVKQYTFEIEKSSSTDQTNARNMNRPHQPPLANGHLGSKPKSEPMLPSVVGTGSGTTHPTSTATGAIAKTEFFDRNLKQRHSSRSVDASTARRDEEEYTKGEGRAGHQRHSSGPSELQLNKVNEETAAPAKKCKDKDEITLHQYDPGAAVAARGTTSSTTAKLLKRHSLGPNEEFFLKQPPPVHDWIRYPLRSTPKKHTFDPTQSSCTDIRRKEHVSHAGHSHRERKLRHSASEVVTSSQSDLPLHSQGRGPAPQKPERTFRYHSRDRDSRMPPALTPAGVPTGRQHSLPQIPFQQQQQPTPVQHFQYPPPQQLLLGQPSTSTFVPQAPAVKPATARKERSRRHRTQRSATVGDINQFQKTYGYYPLGVVGVGSGVKGHRRRSGTLSRSAERSASLTRCADPSCSVMSLCDDPNCYLFSGATPTTTTTTTAAIMPTSTGTGSGPAGYYDTPRCASLPRVLPRTAPKCGPMCYECNNKCNSLPRCTDARCQAMGGPPLPATLQPKSNSLPRNAESYAHRQRERTAGGPAAGARPSREESRGPPGPPHRSSFKSSKKRSASASGSGSNGGSKLTKSQSAASLNSRRRRHKTVHFGENLLREVCQNRKLIQPLQETPSGSAPLQPNIQMLYNFVEGVLSAWVDDEDDPNKSGPESEPERGAMLKPMHRCNRARFQTIRRIVNEAAELKGSSKLGNSRYRHRHWRGTAKDCNERFLRKTGSGGSEAVRFVLKCVQNWTQSQQARVKEQWSVEGDPRERREISDDDRMSLTTAVSDEDDGESVMASPYKAKATGTAAASFNCTGAVRKAGFLSVKKWLLRKKHQIELARKRGWKGYWVCLKGTTLLFYPCDSREGRSVEAAPKHLIIVDGAIMQPIPEHPKRDYIFCLSTAFGDAYLFQAPCQVELENWVNSIHSACAAAFARHRGKTGTLHLLQEEIFRLEKAIESDHKLKHMADLQQSVVTDGDTRHQIQQQILQWEENLERLHCEQFRLRCYMASLQNGELPNPKSLLTHVSRPTKNTLNKLGVFTVSSFHAFICARSPSLLNNLLAGRGATKRRPPILSRSNSGSSRRSMQINSRDEPEKSYKVALPENTFATVYLREGMSVEEFLASACSRKNLNPMEHFVRVKKRRDMEDHNYFVPHRNDLIETYLHTHEVVEVCAKILYQVELQRTTLEQMWGFSVEAELIENADRQDELCCYVSRVEDKSVAMQNGVIKGDEIIVINGAIVSDLDMMYLESVLQEEQALCMMMRSSRTEPPDLVGIMRSTDDIIESLVCPPPPSDPPVISEEMISGLIVPAPGWRKEVYSPEVESSPAPSSNDPHLSAMDRSKPSSRTSSFEIENLLKSAEQVTGFCRSPQETRKSSPTGSVASSMSNVMLTPSRQLTDAEKLRKVILELVDTEKSYVKHLNNLLEYYLEPLKRETFLSNAEITALFGNIQEIVTFQRQFLNNLEEALDLEPDFHQLEHPSQFKNVLFAIGSAFLYYVNHFKLYSSFCASHSKAQKVLHPNEGNQALQEFLAARNPKQQHSSTLESFLIKPIQRILKYPLLLQQLRNLTDPNAAEHLHLVEALKGMEKVAEHINEMQRIHEEYGAIFDHLFRQHQKSCKQPIDLSPGDLLYYGGVEWLNISDFLGKIKKGLELHAMCFVFKSAVVFLCKERLRQKKKLMGVSSKNATNEVEIIRYQVLIPVTEVQVRASSAKDMDSHFLWELIHLRSQLQRRSEKVYVLSNSTAEFRNAFLKTIRQIIRESVRNMSIPSLKSMGGSTNSMTGVGNSSGNSQTLERPKQQPQIMQGSQTLGKPKKSKINQRHSSGNIDYDNTTSGSQEADDPPVPQYSGQFRMRSKTVGDVGEQVAACRRNMTEREQEKPDPGTKSEGEDDSQQGTVKPKTSLGKTPNHLTLSTTSTLSVGSTGSQARLIQSSHPPATYHPVLMKDLGSPVWKPRDMISLSDAPSTSRKDESK